MNSPVAEDPSLKSAANANSRRNAAETRRRILLAARQLFSRNGFANVGCREIATEAGVDAALISRYFGNKAGLFKEVIQGIFTVEPKLREDRSGIGLNLVHSVLAPKDKTDRLNRLNLLLCSVESQTMADIVSERFHEDFVLPLADLLGGEDAEARASVIACYAIGLSTMKHALSSSIMDDKKVVELVSEAMQACVR